MAEACAEAVLSVAGQDSVESISVVGELYDRGLATLAEAYVEFYMAG